MSIVKFSSLAVLLSCFFLANSFVIPGNNVDEKNPEEGDLFEGDIAGIEAKGANQIPTTSRVKWPNGKVPYKISAGYTLANLAVIKAGFKLVEDATRLNGRNCITFVERTVESTYIKIINGTGCWSYVGMQSTPGAQELSLKTPGCMSNAIVAHEFIHALGFWHEQSRPDRDSHIKVMFENITPGTENNFKKYGTSQVGLLNFPYDYDSVMHYGPKSFSNNGQPTIIPLKANVVIGQRNYLSNIDIMELRAFYGCK